MGTGFGRFEGGFIMGYNRLKTHMGCSRLLSKYLLQPINLSTGTIQAHSPNHTGDPPPPHPQHLVAALSSSNPWDPLVSSYSTHQDRGVLT